MSKYQFAAFTLLLASLALVFTQWGDMARSVIEGMFWQGLSLLCVTVLGGLVYAYWTGDLTDDERKQQ